jgi:hypothetical protein
MILKKKQERKEDRIGVIPEEGQRELEKAESVLKAAEEIIQSIKPEIISEIAGYASPSYLILMIID